MSQSLVKKDRPLDLPEIRTRVARFVPTKELLNCVRVCKAWNLDFSPSIWSDVDMRQIDFEGLKSLDATLLSHRLPWIRSLKGVSTLEQLRFLLDAVRCLPLRELELFFPNGPEAHLLGFDLIRRANATLDTLKVGAKALKTQSSSLFSPEVVIPVARSSSSSLTKIVLFRIVLTHEGLNTLLEGSPRLSEFHASEVTVFGAGAKATEPFQHHGVVILQASTRQVFLLNSENSTVQWHHRKKSDYGETDTEQQVPVSLLMYFPLLMGWRVTNDGQNDFPVPVATLRSAVKDHWSLRRLWTESSCASTVKSLVLGIRCLSLIYVTYSELTTDAIAAILTHSDSLVAMNTYFDEKLCQLEPVGDLLGDNKFTVDLLMRHCKNLVVLQLFEHELDLSEYSHCSWKCLQLERFAIRIKGLETKDKIESAIRLFTEAKVWKQKFQKRKEERAKALSVAVAAAVEKESSDDAAVSVLGVTNDCDLNQEVPAREDDRDDTEDLEDEDGWCTEDNWDAIESRTVRFLMMFNSLKSVWLGTKFFNLDTLH
ncbi:hypothetical protein BGZ83_008747 [Gryganskiella cystojenkinii]|nr:hypothetical protein BGZ83_008747 [Gryganskiella cystojenkinii]